MRGSVLWWSVAIAALCTAGATAQRASGPVWSERGSAELSSLVAGAVARGDVPGAVVLVVGPDGVMYHDAFGLQDVARGVPMRKDTIFRIASMTKPLTSLVAMMLVEEGKLRLDDEVGTYVPKWKSARVLASVDTTTGAYTTRGARGPITIEQLLTHTSGIGYSWSHPALAAIQKASGTADLDLPLVNEPGERWMYGASTRVLGDVIAAIMGKPIDVVLRERLTAPLGMADTSFDVPAAKLSRLVTVHQRTGAHLVEQVNAPAFVPSVRGDGGLVSTAGDYGRFLAMLLNDGLAGGRRVAAASAIRAMTSNHLGSRTVERQVAADAARSLPYPLGAGHDTWGLGVQLAAAPSSPTARSKGSYSWAGINNTHFWVDPARRVGVVVLMQVLPFYDDRAMALLAGTEQVVNTYVR